MNRNRHANISLWNIVERLQRRLEEQGLPQSVVDATITRAFADALRAR
ncbi:MAG: hypothetical protein KBG28_05095 [Kofleriaceae bacterium]|jgi:hypothetical protein|nr:hypothetical protein [Kofleriaceae bacterium]MBP6839526.1 hypothetical protein [Kofleriaceae bacterium]MBP9203320.1 hypothetical protein [Kofleriaceae bacterium]